MSSSVKVQMGHIDKYQAIKIHIIHFFVSLPIQYNIELVPHFLSRFQQ